MGVNTLPFPSLRFTTMPLQFWVMREKLTTFFKSCGGVLLGKEHELKLAFTCILARGHLLIEDIPGVGKTTLVQVLARALGLSSMRIQFTSDLLPADIIGGMIFDSSANRFRLHKGPLFAQFILADELNRATPKTQSALLQAMEEGSVSIDNESHTLPRPFFVFATQNPREQAGTFPLPESQIDRFLMRLSLGYPDRDSEKSLLAGENRRELIQHLTPIFDAEDVLKLQSAVDHIHASTPIVEYVQDILSESRNPTRGLPGLSPRAGIGLITAAKAWAFLEGRDMVIPEDVQATGVNVISHRIEERDIIDVMGGERRARELIQSVHVR